MKLLLYLRSEQIDDQISLLINTWCELLLFACCFRSVATPGEIRISHGKSITLEQARSLGLSSCIERMIHFTDHLRRLRVDQFEYAAMKVIILLSSGKFIASSLSSKYFPLKVIACCCCWLQTRVDSRNRRAFAVRRNRCSKPCSNTLCHIIQTCPPNLVNFYSGYPSWNALAR